MNRTLRVYLGAFAWVALSVVASWSALAQADGSAANLLPNPSFEEKAGDGVTGWKSRAWAGEANAQWDVASPGRTGKQCVSISSGKGADAAWTTTVTVKPNTFYRLSGWIKAKEPSEIQHGRVTHVTAIEKPRTGL